MSVRNLTRLDTGFILFSFSLVSIYSSFVYSECLHFIITVLGGGERFAMENALFSSIDKIIEFYQTRDIFETEGQRLRLNNPVTKRLNSKS